jgi:hypothetical protein
MGKLIMEGGVSRGFGTKLVPNTRERADRTCLPAPFLLGSAEHCLGSYAATLDAMRSQEPAQRRHISAHCFTI